MPNVQLWPYGTRTLKTGRLYTIANGTRQKKPVSRSTSWQMEENNGSESIREPLLPVYAQLGCTI